jgi:hypothetical protein
MHYLQFHKKKQGIINQCRRKTHLIDMLYYYQHDDKFLTSVFPGMFIQQGQPSSAKIHPLGKQSLLSEANSLPA